MEKLSFLTRPLSFEGRAIVGVRYPKAPVPILEAILEYAENGTPAGGFVTAVLENDLAGAFARGSRAGLADIVRFVQNEIPHNSHGSREAVSAWTGSNDG